MRSNREYDYCGNVLEYEYNYFASYSSTSTSTQKVPVRVRLLHLWCWYNSVNKTQISWICFLTEAVCVTCWLLTRKDLVGKWHSICYRKIPSTHRVYTWILTLLFTNGFIHGTLQVCRQGLVLQCTPVCLEHNVYFTYYKHLQNCYLLAGYALQKPQKHLF